MSSPNESAQDPETKSLISTLAQLEAVRSNRVAGVRTVLILLSSRGMVFDLDSIRQKILLTYPDAAVFFRTTQGKSMGMSAPLHLDLLIDFTGPGQRQGLFAAKKLRRMARVAVGRNAGLFRRRIYDRVYDEKARARELPADLLERERLVQKEVLALAGVPLAIQGEALPDRADSIALDLPLLSR